MLQDKSGSEGRPMNRRFLKGQDFWCGLLLMSIAVFFLYGGRDLSSGTLLRMGPGYAPRILAALIGIIGVILCLKGLLRDGERVGAIKLRPIVFVLGGMAFFAIALGWLGLIATTFVVVLIACAAMERPRIVEVLALGLGISLASAVLFVFGLRLVIPLWPAL